MLWPSLRPEAVAEGRAVIPGTCFSASLTAVFGPGPEAAVEGCAAGRGICFLRLSPPTLGLARRRFFMRGLLSYSLDMQNLQ